MPPPGGSFGQINFSGSGPMGLGMSGQAQLFDPGQAAGMTDAYDRAADSAAKLKREISQLQALQNQLERDMVGVVNKKSQKFQNKTTELANVNKKISELSRKYANAKKAQAAYEKGMPDWAKHETRATKFLGSLDKSKFSIRLLGRSKVSGHKNHICDFEKESIPQMAFDNVEIVVHLAGYAHSNKNSKEIEKKNMFLNYDVTKKIIEYSINANVKKFIYLSSVKSSEYNSNVTTTLVPHHVSSGAVRDKFMLTVWLTAIPCCDLSSDVHILLSLPK